jgi:hypothetical protein
MKRIALAASGLLAMTLLPGVGLADLCQTCRDKMFIMNIGVCQACKGRTSSGGYKLCDACSKQQGRLPDQGICPVVPETSIPDP